MTRDEERKATTRNFGPVKKALVIQGSPRGRKGWTDHCLDKYLEGLTGAGVESEVVYLNKLNIGHCLGCFHCWTKTPGQCMQKDDMPPLLEKLISADLWVYAVPLYFFSVTGLFKDFLDRTVPLAEPFLIEGENGLTSHPARYKGNVRLVIISVCGFPETDHFGALLDMLRRPYRNMIVGELLRPAAEAIVAREFFPETYSRAMDGFIRAGRETAELGYVTEAAEQAASAPFFEDNRFFYQMANQYWTSELEKAKSRSEA
ncbi:MAG: flavodoxin family protein [Proteobacteria bacterium]|nr:flavodoxin family protein [Pseudomonadota bacterium]